MIMAEKSVSLTFQNNCEAINSNGVEVGDEIIIADGKAGDGDVMIAIDGDDNKCNKDDVNGDVIVDDEEEVAVDEFLAGEPKNDDDFGDELLLANIEAENEGIDFKTDNVIVDCAELEKADFSDAAEDEHEEDGKVEVEAPESPEEPIDVEIPPENCEGLLSKMQIMEEVREGSGIQPNSPGHAEEPQAPQPQQDEPIIARKDEENEDIDEEDENDDPIIINGSPNDDNNIKEDCDEVVQKDEDVKVEEELIPDIINNHVEESSTSSEETSLLSNNNKRKAESPETSTKRLRLDIQENFFTRDKILSEFIEMSDCGNVEQLQTQTEQILAEIRTLNELAKEKEREWNNIIHLKKMKEELLLRMQRRKQVIMLSGSDSKSDNGDVTMSDTQQDCLRSNNQSILKANHNKTLKTQKHRSILPKGSQFELNGDFGKQKQRPILDVQSIIADYRQRHPEAVPRRGRRIRTLASGTVNNQMGQSYDVNTELGLILNALESSRGDGSRPSSAESSAQGGAEPSFKDMLVQFAKLSQTERNELIQNAIKPPPPPYPEVTVHPVPTTTSPAPTNSLLHGILTKSPSKSNSKTSFSPTLARLLTAPERGNGQSVSTSPLATNNVGQAANMSISEILSTSKARNEITITPVGGQFDGPSPIKNKNLAHVEEDEAEDSADRLVIDESNEIVDGKTRGGDNSSDAGDEVPQCQGCNQKSALFVCAGCGNQWYCSRECQVSAWDEHSEVCSG